ncbi:MAG: hypothetical protein R3338_01780 [Thermoanaerobaculia bacterium]|nr:hypothetical protein [Thermoanaerobaculia bacterium]
MSEALRRHDSRRLLLFLAISAAVVALWLWLLRGTFYREHPGIAEVGVAIDLMIVLPLLFWLIAGGSVSDVRKELLTIGAVGAAITLLIVPGAASAATNLIWIAELFVITSVIMRLRKAVKASDREQPLDARIRQISRDLIPFGRAAEAAATEISLIAHTFARRSVIESGGRDHRWKGVEDWYGVVTGLGIVIVAETIGIHLWLHESHPMVAWVILALDLYGILWLVGDARALGASGVDFDGEELDISFGLRWRGRLPIAKIESVGGFDEERQPDLKLALVEDPEIVVTFRDPVVFTAIYGIRKRVRSLGLRVDRPRELVDALVRAGVELAEPERRVDSEPIAKPPEENEKRAARPRMSREQWLKTRPDYVPMEDWLKSKPPWVE